MCNCNRCNSGSWRNRCFEEDRNYSCYNNDYNDEQWLEEKLCEIKRRKCREVQCINEFERCLRHIRCR